MDIQDAMQISGTKFADLEDNVDIYSIITGNPTIKRFENGKIWRQLTQEVYQVCRCHGKHSFPSHVL
jgi:hypothetical protein